MDISEPTKPLCIEQTVEKSSEDQLEVAKNQIEKVLGSSGRRIHKQFNNPNVNVAKKSIQEMQTARDIILTQVSELHKLG